MTQQFTPAQLEAWAGLGPWVIVVDAHFPYNGHVRDQSKDEHVCGVFGEVEAIDEFDSTIIPDDNAALIAAAPDLARLVLEKEKEIARKDAALNQIDALCPSREILAMMHPGAMTKLVLRIGDIVSATLACGVLADRQAMKGSEQS